MVTHTVAASSHTGAQASVRRRSIPGTNDDKLLLSVVRAAQPAATLEGLYTVVVALLAHSAGVHCA